MLAAGLTLRHYKGFAHCPTLPALSERLAREWPEQTALGVHVLVSQNGQGELTVGDSHEYGADVEPFDKPRIDDLILNYLNTFFDFSDFAIARRWHGVYVKHPTELYARLNPAPGATILTGIGGAGMTLSFGAAEDFCERLEGESFNGD